MKIVECLILAAVVVVASGDRWAAHAFVLSDGQSVRCVVQTANGPIDVPETVGYANGFAGFTQLGPNGIPVITFDLTRMPPPGKPADFLFYHECAHARFFSGFLSQAHSELNANCEGLRRMRADGNLDTAGEAIVGAFHASQNVYANYFGSGAAFWNMTLACASQSPQMAETIYGNNPPTLAQGSFCCTIAGARIGPFPPPHLPLGAACIAPVGITLTPGFACN